jgi:hypothetical protein
VPLVIAVNFVVVVLLLLVTHFPYCTANYLLLKEYRWHCPCMCVVDNTSGITQAVLRCHILLSAPLSILHNSEDYR